jgi:hypothetical protein
MRTPYAEALNLPPLFQQVALREVGDAFAHACRIAGPDAAGTLVWVGRFDLVEFALILEPDEPLRKARRAFYAGMVALGDALAVHAPPEKPIHYGWPDAVLVDGGVVGGGRLAWPSGADEEAVPDWLVFAASIRTVAMTADEPGVRPLSTALEEEGFDGLESGRLMESFTRHFMVALDVWQEDGFAALAKLYFERFPGKAGTRREIEENGDLLIQSVLQHVPERRELLPALGRPSWLDAETGNILR